MNIGDRIDRGMAIIAICGTTVALIAILAFPETWLFLGVTFALVFIAFLLGTADQWTRRVIKRLREKDTDA